MTDTSLAFAKINISLDIVSKMADGYHNLKMVMQTVSLSDEISIECAKNLAGAESLTGAKNPTSAKNPPGAKDPAGAKSFADTVRDMISVDTGVPYLPDDERNLAAKAAFAFFTHTGIRGWHTKIKIKKRIPVSAGLGGGSADAACVLRMLSKMHGTGLDRSALEKLGGTVGSDVPFCIAGGTRLAEGRGEILTDLPAIPKSHIVICKPSFSCSTPELFSRVECEKIRARPDTDGLVKALNEADIGGVARRMYNVFEDILPRGRSDVDEIKSILLDHNALGAVMTGSGPAVFGLFDSITNAQNAYDYLKKSYKECYLTQTV